MQACLIETEVFCSLLVTLFVLDAKRTETAVTVTSAAVKRMESFNSRSLDVLAARLWYYYSWAHELAGRLDSVRSTLLAALRTSTLRHDNIGQEVSECSAQSTAPAARLRSGEGASLLAESGSQGAGETACAVRRPLTSAGRACRVDVAVFKCEETGGGRARLLVACGGSLTDLV